MIKKTFSLVIPVYQNEENLDATIPVCLEFLESISEKYNYEFILINDGSKDKSFEILKKYQKKYPSIIKVINFTKNFGQKMSTLAGIKYAKGDAVGVISADLQDPVELFKDMLNGWEKDYKLVIATREERNDGLLNDIFAKIFYKIINKIAVKDYPQGGFDFWLMDREVVNEYIKIDEKNGHLMMTIFNLGYKATIYRYQRKKREYGKSQYNFWKKIKSVNDAIVANSYAPIRMVTGLGLVSSLGAFFYTLFVLISWLFNSNADYSPQGWASLAVMISFFSGLILISLGVIGEYIWRIYDEIRGTPLYVVDEIIDETK